MSAFKNRNRARRAFGRFEALESRLPLAGNVTATLDPNTGLLTVTGDGLNNNILFERSTDPGLYELTGLNDTATNTPTTINSLGGGGSPVFPVASVQSVLINLNDGNDQVLVKNVSLVNVTIFGGEGDDRIDIGDYVPLTTPNQANNQQIITNTLTIAPGAGADVVRVNYVYNATTINITKNTGNPQDIGSLDLAVYVAFTNNLFVFCNDDGVANPQNPAISNDLISLGYVTTAIQLSIDTGDGNDLISYYACRDGNGQAGSEPRFNSGSGDDYVALDVNIYERSVVVDAGEGNDTIQFSRAVFAGSSFQEVRLFCGTGNDTLLVGKYYGLVSGQPVLLDSGSTILSLEMDLGPGDDNATIVANVLSFFDLYMGSGNDSAFLGSNVVVTQGLVAGDFNLDLGTSGTGNDRVRRFNNTMDAFTIDYTQNSIEETTFGPQL